jgi:YggT family protein
MAAFDFLIHSICSLIWWIVIIHVVLSWLISFNIVNMHNQFIYQLYTNLDRLLEPMLRPIRRFLPNMGGLDLSPILLLIGVQFLEIFLRGTVLPSFAF